MWFGEEYLCGQWSESTDYNLPGLDCAQGSVALLLEEMERRYGKHRGKCMYVIGDRLYEHFFEDESLFIWEWREKEP